MERSSFKAQLYLLEQLINKQKNIFILNSSLNVTCAGDVRLTLAVQNDKFDQLLTTIFDANVPSKLILCIQEEENLPGFDVEGWKTFSVAITCKQKYSYSALELFFSEVRKGIETRLEKATTTRPIHSSALHNNII